MPAQRSLDHIVSLYSLRVPTSRTITTPFRAADVTQEVRAALLTVAVQHMCWTYDRYVFTCTHLGRGRCRVLRLTVGMV